MTDLDIEKLRARLRGFMWDESLFALLHETDGALGALYDHLSKADAVIAQIDGYPEWWWDKPQERQWIDEARERHRERARLAKRGGQGNG